MLRDRWRSSLREEEFITELKKRRRQRQRYRHKSMILFAK